jgi:hypothetical protein
MNQLQNLLHDALIATAHVERCALLNKEEYTVRAASVGYQVEKSFFNTSLFKCFLTNFTDKR